MQYVVVEYVAGKSNLLFETDSLARAREEVLALLRSSNRCLFIQRRGY